MPHLVLASASPRRRRLLAEAGYEFTVCPARIDESAFSTEGISADDYARKLALAKARDVAERFGDCLVLGADTVVNWQGQIIGKAADVREAEQIVRKLFGSPHEVITAVALVRLGDQTQIVDSDTTVVYPRKMSDQQIADYVRSGLWRDKAGAYAIQEHGDQFVERIEGSLTNVMGLPMELLRRLLEPPNIQESP